jgi:hypothetical protein
MESFDLKSRIGQPRVHVAGNRRNPFVIVLIVVASVFLATVAIYCGGVLNTSLDAAKATAAGWPGPLAALLGVELVTMIAATVAAVGFEDAQQARLGRQLPQR